MDDVPTHQGHRGLQRTNTGPAIEATLRLADERAIDDPVKLSRAARIIRLALARNRLTLDDLTSAGAP